MLVRQVSPHEALALIREEGFVYVDVRSVQEFEAGHPEGAYNLPLLLVSPSGMHPNPEFLAAATATFSKDAKLIVGCKMGGRSRRAADALAQAGFTQVVDQRAGYEGPRDPSGARTEDGWQPAGLPTATRAEPGRDWASMSAAAT